MRKIVLAILTFLLVVRPAFALSTDTPLDATLSADIAPKSDYVLAYPGILPDNPLYGIKMIRDKIVLLLITDPVKKVKFNLLQADKRLGAGIMLWDSDHRNLLESIETISKGENYFSSAVADTTRMAGEGRDISDLRNELTRASRKHQEILDDWVKKVPERNRPMAEELSSRMRAFTLQLQGLK